MPFVIGEPCIDVTDRSCMDECPVDCIYEGDRKLYINPVECIDCGNCAPVCPVSAIFTDRTVPEGGEAFVDDNAAFFQEVLPGRTEALGFPGGSGMTGVIGIDSPLVRSMS
jgi:Fe-S-cluster-containing hydrogenase component 2